jgi:hypothetical protein
VEYELESELRRLLDKDEIREQLMRYCRGADRHDAALIAGVYHADATVDHGLFRCRGDQAAEQVISHAPVAGMHMIGNLAIELDGDVAYTESYNLVFSESVSGDGQRFTYLRGSRYVDRWERRAGPWRIAFRISVTEVGRYDAIVDSGPPSWPDTRGDRADAVATTFGAPAPDDAVYRIHEDAWREEKRI